MPPRFVDDDYYSDDEPPRHRSGSNRLNVTYSNARRRSRSRGNDDVPQNINIYNTADAYQEGQTQDMRGRAYPPQQPAYYYPAAAAPAQILQPPAGNVVYVDDHRRRRHHSHSSSSRSRSRSHSKHRYDDEEERRLVIAKWQREQDEKKAAEKAAVEKAAIDRAKKEHDAEEAEKEAVLRHQMKLKEEENEKKRIWEEYEVKRKEEENKKKEEKKKFDEEYKERMRKHLAKCGYAPNQIETMIQMEDLKITNDQPGTLVVAPRGSAHGRVIPGVRANVFPKIRRKELAEETLKFYGLEWEYATDPNYIIILQEMTEKETDVLFAHTAKLRERGKGTHILTIEEKKSRGREPELLLVRRKSKSDRSKSRTRDKSQTRGARFAAGVLGL